MKRIPAAALALLLLCGIAPAQEPAGDFADALPEKTVFYLSLENVARTKERLGKSGFAAMWEDPALRPLREKFGKAFREANKDAVNPADVLDFAPGQVCLAAIPVNQNDEEGLILLDIRGKRREMTEFLTRLYAGDEGESRETEEEFRGYTITTRQTLVEGATEPEKEYFAMSDEIFAHCENLDVLKDVLTRRGADEQTGISRTEAFRQVRSGTGERCDLFLYLPASFWLREAGAMAVPVLQALGLENVKGIGGQASFREDGVEMRFLVHNRGESRGLLKVLGGDIEGFGPARILPPDAEPTVAVALDWQLVYRETMRILGMFAPDELQGAKAQIAAVEEQIGFKIDDDLLASLAPGFCYGVLPFEEGALPKDADPAAIEEVMLQYIAFLQKLRNKETFARIITKLTQVEGSPLKQTEYLGTTMWEAELGDVQLAIAVVGDHVAIGMRPETVQALIRRQGKELKSYLDGSAYKEAQRYVPVSRSILYVSDPRASNSGLMYRNFKAGFEAGVSLASNTDASDILPGADFMKKYFGISVFSMSTGENGLLLNWFWAVHTPDAPKDE